MSIEGIEYSCLNTVYKAVSSKYQKFLDNRKQISIKDLVLLVSRQGEGRSRVFKIPIAQLIINFLQSTLNLNEEFELRLRIASSPIYKVGLERFVANSLIKWFFKNKIKYSNYQSPNSGDFAILIDKVELSKLEFSNEDIKPEFDGIVLSVDSKSIMGLKNDDDAIIQGRLGKFEAEWNQLSYIPPILKKIQKSNHKYFNHKYNPLDPIIEFDDKNFLLVSIFVIDLICLPNDSFFKYPLEKLDASYFDHHLSIVCVPNKKLQSTFYDTFFNAGKELSIDKVPNYPRYPKNCRVKIMNNKKQDLIFNNLANKRRRFLYLDKPSKFTLIRYDKGKLQERAFIVK